MSQGYVTQRVENGVTNTPTYNNLNQMTLFTTGLPWSYDANGNVISDGRRTYQWDAADRPTEISMTANSNQMQYTYDGLGRRIRALTTSNGTTTETRFLRCGGRLCQVRDSQDNLTARIYAEGE